MKKKGFDEQMDEVITELMDSILGTINIYLRNSHEKAKEVDVLVAILIGLNKSAFTLLSMADQENKYFREVKSACVKSSEHLLKCAMLIRPPKRKVTTQ